MAFPWQQAAEAIEVAGESRAVAVDRDFLVHRLLPLMQSLLRLRYFRVEIEGAERIPRSGRFDFAPNHAGWFPLDAFVLGYAVGESLGWNRTPLFAVHDTALAAPVLGHFLRRCGALPASWFRRPDRLPPDIESLVVFPEGAQGNTKPFWDAYRMREWKRGFVRVAISRHSSIVPVALLGTEESMPVAWTFKAVEPLIGSALGIPLLPFPLPARFKVVFHEPVSMARYGRTAITNHALCDDLARRIQSTVQETLDRHAAEYPLGIVSAAVHGFFSDGRAAPLRTVRRTSRESVLRQPAADK
jgi:1-acyl-sn-glycerol-3-phosphate acyltransferase